jgi:hypothetical protein
MLCTAAVVIGVAIEESEYFFSWHSVRRRLPLSIILPPHRLDTIARRVSKAGWLIIVLGVAGEGIYEAQVSQADGLLQEFNNILSAAQESEIAALGDITALARGDAKAAAESAKIAKDLAIGVRQEAEQLREAQASRVFRDRIAVGGRLRKFLYWQNGRKLLKVDIEYMESRGGCPDCEGTAKQIERVLHIFANWLIAKEPHGDPNEEDFPEGVTVGVNVAEGENPAVVNWLSDAAEALVKELNCTHINAIRIRAPDGPEDLILVRVGPKPLPRLRPSKAVEPCRNLPQ